MTRDNGTKRVVRVLCLHHLGGNSHQMRRTLQPYFDELAAACPDLCFEPWYVDGPFLLPTALDGGLARGGLSRSTSTGQGATRQTAGEAAEAALTYVSLKRAVDAEEYSERQRPYKYKRTTGDVSEQALARLDAAIEKNRSGGLLQRASEILDSKASADQVRWWQMPCDAYDNPGPWVGHEYSIAYLGRFISEHGPFDGMIGHSGGGLIGQYCHALLAGALDASQEALFPFPMPPAEPASYAFPFSVMFAPVLPDTPRVAYLARVSATPLRSLVLTGKRDSYQTPCEIVCDYLDMASY